MTEDHLKGAWQERVLYEQAFDGVDREENEEEEAEEGRRKSTQNVRANDAVRREQKERRLANENERGAGGDLW